MKSGKEAVGRGEEDFFELAYQRLIADGIIEEKRGKASVRETQQYTELCAKLSSVSVPEIIELWAKKTGEGKPIWNEFLLILVSINLRNYYRVTRGTPMPEGVSLKMLSVMVRILLPFAEKRFRGDVELLTGWFEKYRQLRAQIPDPPVGTFAGVMAALQQAKEESK